jgi:hypothetical protein
MIAFKKTTVEECDIVIPDTYVYNLHYYGNSSISWRGAPAKFYFRRQTIQKAIYFCTIYDRFNEDLSLLTS